LYCHSWRAIHGKAKMRPNFNAWFYRRCPKSLFARPCKKPGNTVAWHGIGESALFAAVKERVMQITDIKIRKVSGDDKLKAYVSLTFDDCFVVHNIKVIAGKAGPIIAMPSRKTRAGQYRDVAHPINGDFRSVMHNKILEKYDAADFEDGPELEPDAVE
jgi:stage V sporulation protein G